MSGLFACFACKRKHEKKQVAPEPEDVSLPPPPKHTTPELYYRSSTMSQGTGDTVLSVLSSRKPAPSRQQNKPLTEYKFPRVESMIDPIINDQT